MFRNSVTLTCLALATQAYAYSNFAASCWSWGAEVNYYGYLVVTATCEPNHDKRVGINLNSCFTNNNGLVSYAPNGHFWDTCKDLEATQGNSVIHVTCGDGKGGWFRNELHLNDWIGNDNGQLKC